MSMFPPPPPPPFSQPTPERPASSQFFTEAEPGDRTQRIRELEERLDAVSKSTIDSIGETTKAVADCQKRIAAAAQTAKFKVRKS